MNELTIIITYYNKEDYILDCIGSIKNQRNQNFDLIIVNDGSTDSSNRLVNEAINNYDKSVNHINLDRNYGHAYARNIALENVETKYFMFLDADDQLASYSVEYYLSKINGLDGLIGPINKFSLKKPQYVNKDKIRIDYLTKDNNPNSFLRKNTVCNILFKTSIVKAHNIRFNEDLKIYIDTSFTLEYIKYVERFVRLRNFPFYFRGEIYDPFEGNTLSDQDFIFTFEDYVNSYLDSIKRTNNKEILNFLSQKMKLEIKKGSIHL